MFPRGTAGAGLFLLRLSVAASLLWEGSAHWTLVPSLSIWLVFVVPAICLCVGLLTPYVATLDILIQLIAPYELGCRDSFHLAMFVLNGAALGALGPGAYSIDARLFGRRILNVPPAK